MAADLIEDVADVVVIRPDPTIGAREGMSAGGGGWTPGATRHSG
jgi:hypothetical protein